MSVAMTTIMMTTTYHILVSNLTFLKTISSSSMSEEEMGERNPLKLGERYIE